MTKLLSGVSCLFKLKLFTLKKKNNSHFPFYCVKRFLHPSLTVFIILLRKTKTPWPSQFSAVPNHLCDPSSAPCRLVTVSSLSNLCKFFNATRLYLCDFRCQWIRVAVEILSFCRIVKNPRNRFTFIIRFVWFVWHFDSTLTSKYQWKCMFRFP